MLRKFCILTMLAASFGLTTASAGMIINDADPVLVSLHDEGMLERGSKETAKQGKQGEPGIQGIKGTPGARGEKGNKGLRGDVGPKGVLGDKGDRGDQGEPGMKGLKGAKGDKGHPGDKGAKGDRGEKGLKGEKGIKGDKGIAGEKGDVGLAGDKGPQGEKGAKGDKGEKGPQGEKGEKGDIGHGQKGAKGLKGEKGEKGAKGEKGEKGEKGARGDKGEKGEKGLKGEKGSIGAKGPKGDKGEPGATGVVGAKGATGDHGPKGPKGEPGEFEPLSTDIFVDGCTKVCVEEQDGSISKPFATIEQALCASRKFKLCQGNDACKTISILIAAGFYNCPENDCDETSSSSTASHCTTTTSSTSTSCTESSSDDCRCDILIAGPQKYALVALGPVTIGCTNGCACQQAACDHPVGIVWVPAGGTCQEGVRPTLTITSLNSFADSITPYQSYSNKFRITGGITVINKNCCDCSIGGEGMCTAVADPVCNELCGETVHVHCSGSDSGSDCSGSFSNSFRDSTRFGSSNETKRHHHSHHRNRNADGQVERSSSDHFHHSSNGSDSWHHASSTEIVTAGGGFERNHSSESFSRSSPCETTVSVHHSESYEKITGCNDRHTESCSRTTYTSLSSELCCPSECEMCTGEIGCLIPGPGENDGVCQVANLCCTQDCLPAELHLNAEVLGGLDVTGRTMLYFYKARVHGVVAATHSDIVVAERTRFDSLVAIHFYGTIYGSEFMNGIQITGCQLYDGCCVSVALQGFFKTYIQGQLLGSENETCCCGIEGEGAPLFVDSVTFGYMCRNLCLDQLPFCLDVQVLSGGCQGCDPCGFLVGN